ncbi:MAG: hypothetical protein AVDCRST_MAG93-3517 [uncultured Chloroflexia bacterium]|uniref:Uncharacterized protein n=1 Tax=uncultured Chloroflexia bacterium TaxID=1672391 RepID=A0A6J4JRS4_9CHLR|nr:MAG: hypothetical protein AVDCRST_MAG93-3517 [uncultured Chloroflexia bacterium]
MRGLVSSADTAQQRSAPPGATSDALKTRFIAPPTSPSYAES